MKNGLMEGPAWKPIPNFPNYWMSDEGTVIHLRTGHIKTVYLSPYGYLTVRLFVGKKGNTRGLHTLYKQTFGKRLTRSAA